ncbi:iron complex transport system ATP-binding protein [Sphingomonas gellani]|uniref:Iron complex transport system ATP-binding protein n=1 Tax=Sphingomonas gellani TaxID=1166340 RepID=A0A1H8BBR7_9SPHN|nr:ABC transporter ATP-binding protein [Sphingomonas gellani]SEM79448.1 iron complex transport system ATP-binding protein [Sphingomonas gellani]
MGLTATGLSVSRAGRVLVDGVDARFASGRITAILGPNGAGKSTLLKALAGLLPASAGGVSLDGQPIGAMTPRERARRIGYLPQDGTVHWNLMVRDLVALGRMPHRSPYAAPSAHDEQAVEQALDATDTTHLADRPVLTLSGGERARVLLARVLAGRPDWLLVDEPLASLDPAYQLDVLARLRAAGQAGAGVVLVLHDLSLALRTADAALLLAGGKVLAAGSADTVLTPQTIAQAYGVEVEVGRTAGGIPYVLSSERL